jgi:hypothetical protein
MSTCELRGLSKKIQFSNPGLFLLPTLGPQSARPFSPSFFVMRLPAKAADSAP